MGVWAFVTFLNLSCMVYVFLLYATVVWKWNFITVWPCQIICEVAVWLEAIQDFPFFVFCTSDLCLQLSGYMRAWQIAHRCESYELQRFPVLRRRIEEVVASFLRDGLAPAETMIGHLIEMEVLFYLYHWDFLDGQNVVRKNGVIWYVTAYCILKMMLRWIFHLIRICCAAFVV